MIKDIDANFSKMQQVLSNRILPAFKRFAIGTEPVREAAKVCTFVSLMLFNGVSFHHFTCLVLDFFLRACRSGPHPHF